MKPKSSSSSSNSSSITDAAFESLKYIFIFNCLSVYCFIGDLLMRMLNPIHLVLSLQAIFIYVLLCMPSRVGSKHRALAQSMPWPDVKSN